MIYIFILSMNIYWYRHGASTLCVHLLNLHPNGQEQAKLQFIFMAK